MIGLQMEWQCIWGAANPWMTEDCDSRLDLGLGSISVMELEIWIMFVRLFTSRGQFICFCELSLIKD